MVAAPMAEVMWSYPGRDVGDQRAEGVERRAVAPVLLQHHVLLDQVQRHVTRTLDHHLHVEFPGPLGQFGQGPQLGELGLVVRVGGRARPQAVAEGEAHVVPGEDLAELVEVGRLTMPVTRFAVSGT
jgi:hypothetical protein